MATLTEIDTRKKCPDCGHGLAFVFEQYISIVYKKQEVMLTGNALVRIKCPNCSHWTHYELTEQHVSA
jgi:formate dehydrogenase maturation protein FdhE